MEPINIDDSQQSYFYDYFRCAGNKELYLGFALSTIVQVAYVENYVIGPHNSISYGTELLASY